MSLRATEFERIHPNELLNLTTVLFAEEVMTSFESQQFPVVIISLVLKLIEEQ